MPFGIAFMGTAFSEFNLISFAYAYEQATLNRLKIRAFPEAIPKTQLAEVVSRHRGQGGEGLRGKGAFFRVG